jgi:hypothetical protein
MSESFHFLDYSVEFFDQLPEQHRYRGKFVQLKHVTDGEFIIFSPLAICSYHAQIVERFCLKREPQWEFEMNPKGDDGQCLEEGVSIEGGGFYEIIVEKKRLNLGGASQAYGPYNNYGLDEKLKTLDQFKDYVIFC